jgi:flavin reductase (DIM6/NTAB) family NADH-FMN oxidoreductase RutF
VVEDGVPKEVGYGRHASGLDSKRLIRLFPTFPVVIAVAGEGDRSNPVTLAMVHVFSFEPPMVGIGVNPKRHSFDLLKELPEFVVALPRHTQAKETLAAGSHSGRDGTKWPKVDLTPVESKVVKPPSIEECPVNLECRTVAELETGDHTWFVGEIVEHTVEMEYAPDDALTYWGGKFRKPGDVVMLRR